MLECRNCFSANADSAKFCDQCGTQLGASAVLAEATRHRAYTPRHLVEHVLKTRSAIIGEKKRVTVMFVDIKGSTRIAEQAGAEAWHGILDRYFVMLGSAVHRFEGTVNQYTGDGIMALFGAPIAHEDHAVRAAWAALQIQRDVRAYADELRLASGLNLSARVGLNSGEVIVGSIGDDLRMDYTAQGLTVHLAARVEQICEPGRVFLTRHTAAQIDGYFRLRDLGETRVAGSDAPLRIYELEGEGAATTRLQRAFMRGAARFVGREAELASLHAARERSLHGNGGIVAMVGVAGIGKSRLCHEFAADCERRGIKVLRASAVPYAAALPLLPVQSLLRQRLGLPDQGGDAAEARRLVAGSLLLFDAQATALLPQLLDFLGIAEPSSNAPRAQPSPADRSRLLEVIARLLAGGTQPQLLLLEDLHFADPATEQFLATLAAHLGRSTSLLLCNYRPEYSAQWLDDLDDLDAERLSVSALGDSQIEAVALDLLGTDASVAALPQQLRERAAGNPFYVEEAVQALKESGHLQGERGACVLSRAIERWPIPDTIHGLVAARIDRLDAVDKELLQAAAVIGQRFAVDDLAQLLARSAAECRDSLRRLATRCFVEPEDTDTDTGDWRFVHPLMQDVTYRAQLERARAEVHGRVALRLENRHPLAGPPAEISARVAMHWRRASQWERAAAWNIQAARWAMQKDSRAITEQFRLARTHAGRAPRSASVDRLHVIALAGLVRMAQFTDIEATEVDEAYETARQITEGNGDTEALAELLISYGSEHLHRGDSAAAVRTAAEAVQLALDADAPQLIERFRLSLLLIHGTAGYPREGLALVERASGKRWLQAPIDEDNFMSRGFSSLLLAWLGRIKEAEQQLESAIAFADLGQRPASWMYAISVDLALLTGDYTHVLTHARRSMQQAETHGSPYFRAISLRALGQAHLLQGDAAAAVPLLEQMMPLVAPGAHAHQFESRSLSSLAMAYLRVGAEELAHTTACAAVDSARRSHSRVWEIMAWIGYLRQPVGGLAKARAEEGLARVGELIEQAGADGARPWWWLARSEWSRDAGVRQDSWTRACEGFAEIGADAQLRRLLEHPHREL